MILNKAAFHRNRSRMAVGREKQGAREMGGGNACMTL